MLAFSELLAIGGGLFVLSIPLLLLALLDAARWLHFHRRHGEAFHLQGWK